MTGNTVSLDDSFGASSVHAKLSVLIIIASAFRSHLTDLMTAADWPHEIACDARC